MRIDKVGLLATAVMLTALAAAPRPSPVDVAIQTTVGTIVVRLDPARAPNTTKNFLHYVDLGTYNGASFYRSVSKAREPQSRIEVIQGGLNPLQSNPMTPPIALEPTNRTGLRNTDGTIAMARTSDPNSATTEFFIDIGDDSYLDAGGATGPGYAAFGKVVRGMDVVRKIQRANVTTNPEMLSPPIKIVRISRVR
jgi:peptidyl-prolyl cis-trans isomerase A (cyclophilin A)